MFEQRDQKPPERRPISLGLRLTIIGFLIIWGASIAFTLQLKTLLTPGRYSVGSDPSFDILVAVLCFVVVLLGILLLWRGIREVEGLPGGKLSKYITIAAAINVGLIILVLVIAGLVFSGNRAFATQYQVVLRDEPAPDTSMPAFPTPLIPQPTPTYNPASVFLSGPLTSHFDGLRVGNIWISASKSDNVINYIQVYTNRLDCRVQQGNAVSTFAVNQGQQLVSGPIQRDPNGNFYAAQDMVVIQGVMGSTSSAYGTVYVHYIDPTTNRSCDLGAFAWTASATGP